MLVTVYYDRFSALLPKDAEIFDAHVHVGTDIDGFVSTLDDLLAFLPKDGVSPAVAFCLDAPDREPGFRAANDRTLESARASNGVLVPFARLDLARQPAAGATPALA